MAIETETTVSYFCKRAGGAISGIFEDGHGIFENGQAKEAAFARIAGLADGAYIIERTTTTEHDDDNPMHAFENSTSVDREIYRKGA